MAMCEPICEDYRGAAGAVRSTLTELHRQINRLQSQHDSSLTEESNRQRNCRKSCIIQRCSELRTLWSTANAVMSYQQRTRQESEMHFINDDSVLNMYSDSESVLRAALDFSLSAHLHRLDTVLYARAFVQAAHKCIIDGYCSCHCFFPLIITSSGIPVSGNDVEMAIDELCDEFTLHMNMTEYVRLVCKHTRATPDDDEEMAEGSRRSTLESQVPCTHLPIV